MYNIFHLVCLLKIEFRILKNLLVRNLRENILSYPNRTECIAESIHSFNTMKSQVKCITSHNDVHSNARNCTCFNSIHVCCSFLLHILYHFRFYFSILVVYISQITFYKCMKKINLQTIIVCQLLDIYIQYFLHTNALQHRINLLNCLSKIASLSLITFNILIKFI